MNRSILSWIALTIFLAGDVKAQPALGATFQKLDRAEQCVDLGDEACRADFLLQQRQFDENPELLPLDEDDEDPMLAKMPGLDFKAYRRADISSMYREAPGSRVEQTPHFNGMAGKFVNMSPERLDLHWDNSDGPPGNFISRAGPFESTGTCTFPDHVFYFLRPKTQEVVCSFRMKKGTSVYYCNPFVPNDPKDPSAGIYSGPLLQKQEHLTPEQLKLYDAAQFNREFAPVYKNFTGGSEWLGNYPTQPPKHHMWRADYFGQSHTVQSRETQFVELPPAELLNPLSWQEMKRNASEGPALMEYRQPGVMNITIKAVSVSPRIFQIDGFLSEVEVDQ